MIANRGKSAGKNIPMTAGLKSSDISGMVHIIEDNTEFILNAIDRALAESMNDIGAAMKGHAQQLCPVDTGRLRNSITYRLGGEGYSFPGFGAALGEGDKSVVVGTDVEYAAYVELGTRKMRAQPYLTPAATKYANDYRRIVEEHMRNG